MRGPALALAVALIRFISGFISGSSLMRP